MSHDAHHTRSGPGQPVTAAPRTDFFTRDLVNQAIAAAPTVGLKQAAEYLAAMKVPATVAIRALSHPPARRADGAAQEEERRKTGGD